MRDTVVFTVCRRPFYFREALASWGEVRGIQDWRLIFMVEPTEATHDQVKIIDAFRHPDKQVVFNRERLGVLVNPWEGLETSFSTGSQYTVLAEEDLVVSDDVLEFQAWARDEFRDAPEVYGVMSQMQGSFETDDPEAVALVQNFNPWVWGTWKDRWESVLRDTWDKDYSSGNPDGSRAGWDWNIAQRVLPSWGGFMVVPGAARSQNTGQYLGVHAVPEDFEGTLAKTFRSHRPRCDYRLADNR